MLLLGIDVGSTTVKLSAFSSEACDDHVSVPEAAFSFYERHNNDVSAVLVRAFTAAAAALDPKTTARVAVTGSAGLAVAAALGGLPHIQEVLCCGEGVKRLFRPRASAAFELGGEDAKLLRFHATSGEPSGAEMNAACAAGTGAIVDQMAALLQTDASGLNELASRATRTYPIAARCGVFAKADLQGLLSGEGASREDAAASVLLAVARQAVAGLSGGRPVTGTVALVGGPLHFLPELCKAFADTLGPSATVSGHPAGHAMVAMGAALFSSREGSAPLPLGFLVSRAERLTKEGPGSLVIDPVERLAPLFSGPQEIAAFRDRHARATLPKRSLAECNHGAPVFLGIDAGSTTLKLALIDESGALLDSHYMPHQGDPLRSALDALVPMLDRVADAGVTVAGCAVTGYGESLLRSALHADGGVVETVAHLRAARAFLPDADFVLDIGGQDMKAMRAGASGEIADVLLNEACSSGCGSFLQSVAGAIGITVSELAQAGLESRGPLDLGTRCTVFMNSRVKALRNGASLADLSAGLAISIARNALFKVVRLRSAADLDGRKVVVQGGTFMNDSVLRAVEFVLGREVVRPDVAGLMGALGAAIEARGLWERNGRSGASTLMSTAELKSLQWTKTQAHCGRCSNNCGLTVHKFSSGTSHVTGNRCERGAIEGAEKEKGDSKETPPDMFEWQRRRVFRSKTRKPSEAPRGRIGVARALDMWDKFPFWQGCLTALGFCVVPSPESNERQASEGALSVPVESVCYPCKLVHGHTEAMIRSGTKLLFMPCVPRGFSNAATDPEGLAAPRLNCPLVNSYTNVISACHRPEEREGVRMIDAALPLHDLVALARRLHEEFAAIPDLPGGCPSEKECKAAVAVGMSEQIEYYNDLREKGDEAIRYMERTGAHGVILACRPYQLDPLVAGGISAVARTCVQAGHPGVAIFTAESVMHMATGKPYPNGIWWHREAATYDSRIMSAARICSQRSDMAFVHLLSFGCAICPSTDEFCRVAMAEAGHPYSSIKVDQNTNVGAIRARLRSLFAAMDEFRNAPAVIAPPQQPTGEGKWFINGLASRCRKAPGHKILFFDFSTEHSRLWAAGFNSAGCEAVVIPSVPTREAAEIGYRYVHPDVCYGGVLIIGQTIWCLKNLPQFHPDHTDVIWMHQGGACTAPLIGNMMRAALNAAGYPQVQVNAIDFGGTVDPGVMPGQALRINMGLAMGDVLQCVLYRTRPYEEVPGSAQALFEQWQERGCEFIKNGNLLLYKKTLRAIVADFDALKLRRDPIKDPLTRVGIIGLMGRCEPELYRWIVDKLERAEGCEVVPADFQDYSLLTAVNERADRRYLSTTLSRRFATFANEFVVNVWRGPATTVLKESQRFHDRAPQDTMKLYEKSLEYLSPAHQTGEGWVVMGHLLHLIESGLRNIIITASFGCLSINVGGKGVLSLIREKYPDINICIIDIDAGQTVTNQYNRIKLMLGPATGRRDRTPAAESACLPLDLEDIGIDGAHSVCCSCSKKTEASCPARPSALGTVAAPSSSPVASF